MTTQWDALESSAQTQRTEHAASAPSTASAKPSQRYSHGKADSKANNTMGARHSMQTAARHAGVRVETDETYDAARAHLLTHAAYRVDDIQHMEKVLLEAGVPLMSHAAHALADVTRQAARILKKERYAARGAAASSSAARANPASSTHIVALVGAGKNGADALYAAAQLLADGFQVSALAVGARIDAAAYQAYAKAGGMLFTLNAIVGDAANTSVAASGLSETVSAQWASSSTPTPMKTAQHAASSSETQPAAISAHTQANYDEVSAAVELAMKADIVLDAITGIGSTGALRGGAAQLVSMLDERLRDKQPQASRSSQNMQSTYDEHAANMQAHRPLIIAVDVPSGVGVDDGSLPGAYVHADLTLTMGALRGCCLLPPAAYACGVVIVADLDLPVEQDTYKPLAQLADDALVARALRKPCVSDCKYTRGVVGLITGSQRYPGAGVLSALAAARSNVGMVRYVGPQRVEDLLLARLPEAVMGKGHADAWVMGSGVPAVTRTPAHARADAAATPEEVSAQAIQALLHHYAHPDALMPPAIIDAGALSLMREPVAAPALITPHYGELAALLNTYHPDACLRAEDIAAQPLHYALQAQRLTNATVLLKGAITIITDGEETLLVRAGLPWLATAGSGDVLAGILGSICAQNAEKLSSNTTTHIPHTPHNSPTQNAQTQNAMESSNALHNTHQMVRLGAAGAYLHAHAATLAATGIASQSALQTFTPQAVTSQSFTSLSFTPCIAGSVSDAHLLRALQLQATLNHTAQTPLTHQASIGHPILASDIIEALPQAIEEGFSWQ